MEDSTQGWTQLRPFLTKSGLFFSIFKKGQGSRGGLPPPLVACLFRDSNLWTQPSFRKSVVFSEHHQFENRIISGFLSNIRQIFCSIHLERYIIPYFISLWSNYHQKIIRISKIYETIFLLQLGKSSKKPTFKFKSFLILIFHRKPNMPNNAFTKVLTLEPFAIQLLFFLPKTSNVLRVTGTSCKEMSVSIDNRVQIIFSKT